MNEKRKLMVRPLVEEDIKEVVEIGNEVFIDPWNEKQFLYELKDNDFATLMVVTYADKIVGYVDFWVTFDSATISQIAVRKSLQGKGLGKLLFADTIARIEGVDEVNTITLEVRVGNEAAINFYLDHGFDIVLTKKGYYENGEDAHYMMKVVKENANNNPIN